MTDAINIVAADLDTDVSVGNALLQVDRVASARRIPKEAVIGMVQVHPTGRDLGILGEPRVNDLTLNLHLDGSG